MGAARRFPLLNATHYGGGVSELLRSEVPLLRDLGLDAQWCIIFGDECARRVADLLQRPEEARALGAAGRAHIAEHFLMPRLIPDELRLLASLD